MRTRNRFSILTATVLLGVGLVGAEPGAQTPEQDVVVLASSERAVWVEVRVPVPTLVRESAGGREYLLPAFDGYRAFADPGTPAVPGRIIRVAVPPEGEISLEYTVGDRGAIGGVRLPPVAEPVPAPPLGTRRRPDPQPLWRASEGPAYTSARALPQAELLSVGIERGVRIAHVVVRPLRWDAATETSVPAESIRFTLNVTGASAARTPGLLPERSPRRDRVGQRTLAHQVVNPQSAAKWVAAETVNATALPEVWFDDADGWVRLEITGNGVYRLTLDDLAAAGVPVGSVDPRRLRLYAGPLVPEVSWGTLGWQQVENPGGTRIDPGWRHVDEVPGQGFNDVGIGAEGGLEEVALWVRGEADGRLDDGDDVIFYALGPDNFRDRFGLEEDPDQWFKNLYTDRTVYWLGWGEGLPGAALRMESRDEPAGETTGECVGRLHEEDNTIYDPAMYVDGTPWEGWFWEFLTSQSSGQRKRITLPHLVPGTQLTTHVLLWGAQKPLLSGVGQEDLHHVQLTVNGDVVPRVVDGVEEDIHVWGGGVVASFDPYFIRSQPIPAEDLTSFVFTVLKVGNNPDRFDMVYLTWIDVLYRRMANADGGPAEFTLEAAESERTLRVSNVPGGGPLAFSVQDFRRPQRLIAARNGGSIDVNCGLQAGVVAVTTETALARPASITAVTPPRTRVGGGLSRWLRDPSEPLDYIIIAGKGFEADAELLADWRRENLWGVTDGEAPRQGRVRVVPVQEVMNEFSWGMWDPAALRYFLEFAYRCYGNPESDDRLAYALFVGDHTYDFRDYEDSGVVDHVPSWENNRDSITQIRNGNTQYVSDDPLARFDGINDQLTDLYIGRLTVSTPQESRALITQKIIRSEQSPDLGPWRTKAILVADDVCQGRNNVDAIGFVHMAQSEDVAAKIPAVFDIDKVYLYEFGEDCEFDTKPEAKRALLQSWTDGAWLVNYIGHGGDVVLADEQVLHAADVPVLANHGRLPAFGAFSCSVGKFSKPLSQGLAESLLRTPTTGALVAAAATHLTFSGRNARFNITFLDQLFREGADQPIPIGVALMNSKRIEVSDNGKYVCLGDPASRLTTPGLPMTVDGPQSLLRGKPVTYQGAVLDPGSQEGRLETVARDSRVLVTTNSKGETFREHADRLFQTYGERPSVGAFPGWYADGATLFRGESPVTAGSAEVQFTVPASLRGGAEGKVRTYGWGDGWDGLGAVLSVEVGGTAEQSDDTEGPTVTYSVPGGTVAPGQEITVTLEDASGINQTQLFEFRSILLKILDDRGLEQVRLDLTDRFAYDLGSHTRGTAAFTVPELPPGTFTFSVSAFDNLNNTGVADAEFRIAGGGGEGLLSGVASYPNPFNPDSEPTRILFTLEEPGSVSIRIYSVSGRLVLSEDVAGDPGRNGFQWNGRDGSQDLVANGVYLARIEVRTESGAVAEALERVVVVR